MNYPDAPFRHLQRMTEDLLHRLQHDVPVGRLVNMTGKVVVGQFQPDDATAHHQQTARGLRQLERIGGVENSRILR